jgi:hypothetical protein
MSVRIEIDAHHALSLTPILLSGSSSLYLIHLVNTILLDLGGEWRLLLWECWNGVTCLESQSLPVFIDPKKGNAAPISA